MGGLLVGRGSRGGAVGFDEHKTRRIVGLLYDIEPGDPGFTDRLPGVLQTRGLEGLDRLGFDLNMNLNDEHGETGLPGEIVQSPALVQADSADGEMAAAGSRSRALAAASPAVLLENPA
jgi:hypothetical protein